MKAMPLFPSAQMNEVAQLAVGRQPSAFKEVTWDIFDHCWSRLQAFYDPLDRRHSFWPGVWEMNGFLEMVGGDLRNDAQGRS